MIKIIYLALQEKKLIFFSLLSLALHLIAISAFSLYIDSKPSPSISAWFNIIGKNELFFDKKIVNIPAGVNLSSDTVRHQYFPLFPQTTVSLLESKKNEILVEKSRITPLGQLLPTIHKDYFYLWDRPSLVVSYNDRGVPFRAFVSSHGKVIFLYPEKLAADSNTGIYFQNHVREAAFFTSNTAPGAKTRSFICMVPSERNPE